MKPRVLALVPFALAACSDHAKDVPAASVSDPAPKPAAQAAAPKPSKAASATYALSPANTSLEFVGAKVTGKHEGTFGKFSGEIVVADGKPETGRVSVEIDMSTVATDSEKLDGHLKSPDFFDVAKFPRATFTSTAIAAGEGGKFTVTGQLQLHGVTKTISFPAEIQTGPGNVSVKADFKINRQDFGVKYPGMPDDLISDDVALSIRVDAKAAQ